MTMTETLNPTTVRTVDPEVRAAILEAGDALIDAAAAARIQIGVITAEGARRRAHKLVTQIEAAGRLLRNGSHLDAPPAVRHLAARAVNSTAFTAGTTAQRIDGDIDMWRTTLVGLHAWRGHTASVPAEA